MCASYDICVHRCIKIVPCVMSEPLYAFTHVHARTHACMRTTHVLSRMSAYITKNHEDIIVHMYALVNSGSFLRTYMCALMHALKLWHTHARTYAYMHEM
jgi:hypothetical protein